MFHIKRKQKMQFKYQILDKKKNKIHDLVHKINDNEKIDQ